jgi:hypothetical protein
MKRNQQAKQGFGVETPLDAIHLADGKQIRLEGEPVSGVDGDLHVGNRIYNDGRYLKGPIEVPVGTVFVLGYDEDRNVILTALNPEVGAGLSLDVDGKVQLGDSVAVDDNLRTVIFEPANGIDGYNGKLQIHGQLNNYLYKDFGVSDIGEVDLKSGLNVFEDKVIFVFDAYRKDLNALISSSISSALSEIIFSAQDLGTNNKSAGLTARAGYSGANERAYVYVGFSGVFPDKTGEMSILASKNGLTENFTVKDTIRNKGLEEEADYSANKTDFSYATKKMLVDGLASVSSGSGISEELAIAYSIAL